MSVIIIIVHPEGTARCAQPLSPRFHFPHPLLPSHRPSPPPTSTHGVRGYTRGQHDEQPSEIALHPDVVPLWREFRSLWVSTRTKWSVQRNKLKGCCAMHQRGCSSDSGGRKNNACARREAVCALGATKSRVFFGRCSASRCFLPSFSQEAFAFVRCDARG